METATYDVLNRSVFEKVYEPAEDTFILIDAVEQDLELIQHLRPDVCLEIGSGSGVVLTSISKALGKSKYYLATDISRDATEATKLVATQNATSIEVVQCNLLDTLISRLFHSVDLMVFNPPYLIMPDNEIEEPLQVAINGGTNGCKVIEFLIDIVPQVLSYSGLFYLVCIKENNPERLIKSFQHEGIIGDIVLSRKCGIEKLFVLRFFYPDLLKDKNIEALLQKTRKS